MTMAHFGQSDDFRDHPETETQRFPLGDEKRHGDIVSGLLDT